jgi:hypothetical protein
VRLLALLLIVATAPLALGQEAPKKKKPAAKKQLAHKKPTPEQIRKFNELQKKR